MAAPLAPLLDQISARISDWGELDRFWAMATLISPNRAITAASAIQNAVDASRQIELFSPRLDVESTRVDVVAIDHGADLAVLALTKSFPVEVPLGRFTRDLPCETLTFDAAHTDGMLVPGKLQRSPDTFPAARFEAQQIAAGAAVVADGQLLGIVTGNAGFGHLVVTTAFLTASPMAIAAGMSTPAADHARAFGPEALAVLRHAEGIRAAAGVPEIHMDFLVLALAANDYLGLRYDETEALLRDHVDFKLPPAAAYAPRRIGFFMPPLSKHAERALREAVHIAGTRGLVRVDPPALVEGALSVTDCTIIRALTEGGLRPSPPPTARAPLAGYLSDQATDVDHLGVTSDAYALCSVLGAEDVRPPVSVGLFGEWGAGKSSFMKVMEQQFKRIEATARAHENETVFCRRIVQLWFNAWHYVDQNLYASLAREIFEGLNVALTVKERQLESAEELAFRRKEAERRRDEASARVSRAAKARSDAEAKLAAVKVTLDQIESDPKAVQQTFTSLDLATSLATFIASDEVVKKNARLAAEHLHVPPDDALALLGDVRDTFDAAAVFLKRRPLQTTLWALLAIATFAVALAFQNLRALGATGGVILLWASWIGYGARMAANFLRRARARETELLDAKRSALTEERQRLQAEVNAATQAEMQEAVALKTIQDQVDLLHPERRLASYVQQRRLAYDKQLGVIGEAHKDFRELSEFLRRVTAHGEAGDALLPPIDRIVLYIDDLDRCPEEKVFEVLQAVHLLLAFELFVVVVAVDPRWLLHAVEESTKRPDTKWRTIPLDYLEKIFQIPYTLGRMEKNGFEALVDAMTRPLQRRSRRPSPLPPPTPDAPPPNEASTNDPADPERRTGPPESGEVIHLEAATATSPTAGLDPAPEHLVFEEHEIGFIKELRALMSSPRNAKRFVNVYRLVRSALTAEELRRLRDPKLGEHKAAQIIVVLVTNHPEKTAAFCTAILNAPTQSWGDFATVYFKGDDELAKPVAKLTEAHTDLASIPLNRIERWIRRAARYSFDLGQLVSAQPESDALVHRR